ncbi:hypothetical protein SARC_03209 [Sphaeroforma arctica JP610]|uniref:Uncharacterized protein n=1 Tax=Sphaeroforma arctica JP610 TaxID=667725 RepID=A0A0L0G6T6_9EUKA|nr:hypothetical protein SARC_03209 [Sphaeroforma arctica JP610]KNC84566.1 hypothetical protein SARC_03209 [Sphaeroforma arctica JP610]|eukprot:XP_014158468.1 hypothetical protein SARC_03209 [Sphaeroforma arctica JP610]
MDLYKAKNGLKATSYNKSKSSNGLGIVQPMQRVAENIDTDDIPLRRNRSVRREKRARRRRQMIMADSSEESDR